MTTASTILVPSDHLARLREFLITIPYLMELFGVLPQLRFVIDSNIIIHDLIWLIKHRQNPSARTGLQEVIASETIIAFAPNWLRTEIEKHIPIIAAEQHIPVYRLQEEWLSYQKYL